MLGAITGDIIGSVYEKRNLRRKDFSPLFHPQARFTDDTVCLVAIADSVLNKIPPTQSLQSWGRAYEHNGGWGQHFALWLTDENPQPYGSFGNGGAMRIAPVAWLSSGFDEMLSLAQQVTEVTHNHPEGLRGALATASAVWWSINKKSPEDIRKDINKKFGYDLSLTVDHIRIAYRHTESAANSVPQALTCALEASNYEDAIRNAISIGGDSDTVATIAGAVAEAQFGLPEELAHKTWDFLPNDMRKVITEFYNQVEKINGL